MPDNPNEFYNGYENAPPPSPPDDTQKQQAQEIANAPAKQFKRELFLMILLCIPMSIFIGFLLALFILIPYISAIGFALKDIVSKMFFPLSFAGGIISSYAIVQKLTVIGDEKNQKIINKHTLFLTACCVLCFAASSISSYIIPFILILTAVAVAVFSIRFLTAFEKKFFLPIMCICILSSAFLPMTRLIRDMAPQYHLKYDTAYYFVSKEEITPKNQNAQYYIDENIPYDTVLMGGDVLNFYGSLEDDILDYDNLRYEHYLNCEPILLPVLRTIVEDNAEKYDEKFFDDYSLMIFPVQYNATTTKIDITDIVLKNEVMTLFQDTYCTNPSDETSPNEFCFVFITVPKYQRISDTAEDDIVLQLYEMEFKENIVTAK